MITKDRNWPLIVVFAAFAALMIYSSITNYGSPSQNGGRSRTQHTRTQHPTHPTHPTLKGTR